MRFPKLFIVYFLITTQATFASLVPFPKDTTSSLLRDKNTIVLPVVFRFPETRWGGGIAGTSTFSFQKDSSWAKPSQISYGVTITQNRQLLIFAPFTLFLNNNKWYIFNDSGWFRYNYFYYGIGENRVAQEVFNVDFPRVRVVIGRQVGKSGYAGIRYGYEAYKVTKTEPGGELASGTITGSDFSRTSALGLSYIHDRRDQVFYPRKGSFGEFFIFPSRKQFGADVTFTRFYADFSFYQSLRPKIVLATNLVGSAIFGEEVPFNQLSFLGGQKKMRGLYEGFFRDRNTALIQEEIRIELGKVIGLVGFGSIGWMGDQNQLLRIQKPKFSYGGGLRIATKNHLNLRLDYGFSPYTPGSFYATIGEAF
ncbi:MAG: BamA/TamA family outer membrane protein [Spirosomataceae bacterium]